MTDSSWGVLQGHRIRNVRLAAPGKKPLNNTVASWNAEGRVLILDLLKGKRLKLEVVGSGRPTLQSGYVRASVRIAHKPTDMPKNGETLDCQLQFGTT